ncbi:MAG: hypothetical protein HYZ86_01345 [Candidatus Omnitrophica bacterium]|nr:hypothetical protein [Candidatus Omnitrophota bacterium]
MKAQSTLEFVFAMIAVMFLLYGMVQVFRWVGMDMAQRRYAYDASFNRAMATGSLEQLKLDAYYHPSRIHASPRVDLGQ